MNSLRVFLIRQTPTKLNMNLLSKRTIRAVPTRSLKLKCTTTTAGLIPCMRLTQTNKILTRTFFATPAHFNSDQKEESPVDKKQMLLRENIYTIPNMLTVGRLIAAPYVGYLIIQHEYPLALGVFVAAGLTDMLDGFIARRYNLKTIVGSIIDPMADKALMTVLTITLASQSLLPMSLAYVILGRDAGLIIAAFYYRYISLPKPKTLVRYFDFSIPSAEVRPTQISKINTLLQLVLMSATLTTAVFQQPSQEILTSLQWLVGGTTIWSGASYVFSKDAVRILNQPSALNKKK